jgi:DNA-binding MarR family transcriptional regulator/GNAT superfamily N-acetyltransferase
MDLSDPFVEPRHETVERLRDASRRLVRELGFMRSTLADTALSASAVHAVLELGRRPGLQARELAQLLRLDKSNASRQLCKLEELGFVERIVNPRDARSAFLHLTRAGRALRDRIDAYATQQVSRALQHLQTVDQQTVTRALGLYADALAATQEGAPVCAENGKTAEGETLFKPEAGAIVEGYAPGCVGDIASLHARFYAELAGFGAYFEKKVATELAEFAYALPSPDKRLWIYREGDRTLASIAVEVEDGGVGHLRWFIVDGCLRGSGVGRRLLEAAVAFIERECHGAYLWTFSGLDAARHLYEQFGFVLTEQATGEQWGVEVTEQRFERGGGEGLMEVTGPERK